MAQTATVEGARSDAPLTRRVIVSAASRTTRRLALAGVVASSAAGLWIFAAMLTANHGFDSSDEGYYLLTYRWWDTNPQNFSGAQYVYGPVFELLDYDIADLRLFRLFTVVGTTTIFGLAMMRWLRQRRPSAPTTKCWEFVGVAVILASGGMIYSWLPLSPGYNDVSLLGALLAAAIALSMATYVSQGVAVPAWLPVALGPVIVAMLLAKWASSVLTLGLVAAVCCIVLASQGRQAVCRVAAWTLSSVLLAMSVLHVTAVPLTTVIPEMVATNRLVAAATNSPAALLAMYGRTTAQLLTAVLASHALLLLAAAVAARARGRTASRFVACLVVVAVITSAWQMWANDALAGGAVNLGRFPTSVLLVVLVALVVGTVVVLDGRPTSRKRSSICREDRGGCALIGMLFLLPIAQAAGTGNALHIMAINGFAAWTAIMVYIATGLESAAPAARWLSFGAAAAAALMSAGIATSALWSNPYRTAERNLATVTASDVPALHSVALDVSTALAYSQLRKQLRPYIEPAGRRIMAFDEMAGLVFILDGQSVGEAWYSATDPQRTAAGIREQCQGGEGLKGARPPILLFRRAVTATEVDALQACGLSFSADYDRMELQSKLPELHVYVPDRDASDMGNHR